MLHSLNMYCRQSLEKFITSTFKIYKIFLMLKKIIGKKKEDVARF